MSLHRPSITGVEQRLQIAVAFCLPCFLHLCLALLIVDRTLAVTEDSHRLGELRMSHAGQEKGQTRLGGLLVVKTRRAFVRLEKTSGPHAFNGDVRFERHYEGGYQLVGRGAGLKNAKHLYLRLERRGNRFTAFASDDGVKWLSCGETVQGMRDPVTVGLHALCPGGIPPTETRFDYFGIFRRPHEASLYRRQDRRRFEQNDQLSTLTALRRIAR